MKDSQRIFCETVNRDLIKWPKKMHSFLVAEKRIKFQEVKFQRKLDISVLSKKN